MQDYQIDKMFSDNFEILEEDCIRPDNQSAINDKF